MNEIVFDNCDEPYQYFFRRVHDIACLLDECMNCFLKARICQITPKDLSSKDDLSFYIVGSRCSSKVMISKFWNDIREIFGISMAETLAETIESDPLCITDLFQNKSVAFFLFIISFL